MGDQDNSFFQVYWDPNRQAIHDKICATVVIKGEVPQMTADEITLDTGEGTDVDLPDKTK